MVRKWVAAGEGGMMGPNLMGLNQSRVSFTKQNRSAIVFPSKQADEFQDLPFSLSTKTS